MYGKPVVAIESKLNATNPKPARGFHQGCEDLKIDQRWIIYPGKERIPLANGAEAISLPASLQRMAALTGSSE